MAENSKISWTDHTFNPWIGFTKVSPGCAHCYADQQDKLRKWTAEGWGKGKPRKRTSADNWKGPIKWNKERSESVDDALHVFGEDKYIAPHRPRVFCASLADWLDDEVPIEWLADLLNLIHDTPNLDWLLLTKRPQNWLPRLITLCDMMDMDRYSRNVIQWVVDWRDGIAPHNVWLGTSVENQQCADERIPVLLSIPARVRFLSCEPLLFPVDLRLTPGPGRSEADAWHGSALFIGDIGGHEYAWSPRQMIQWVICGGESGPGHSDMNIEWAGALAEQCSAGRVAFFMKQDSGSKPGQQGRLSDALFNRKEFPNL